MAKQGFVVVNNKTARLIGIGKQHNAKHKGVADVNADVVLKPGVNEVPEAAWARAEEIVTVQHLMKDGSLEVEAHVQKSLSELSEDEAVKLVGETFDAKQLDRFADHKSKRVKDAIERQRKVIAKTDEEKAKEEAARKQKENAAADAAKNK